MFNVTTKSVSDSVLTITADSEGEMLDRVRYAMQSEYITEVSVTKTIENLLRPTGLWVNPDGSPGVRD